MALIPQAYLFQAPTGVPGDITRTDETNVEPAMLVANSGVFAAAYGIPMKYVTGGIQQFSGSEAATAFAGVLVREVPSQANNVASDQVYTPTAPYSAQVQGLAVRGYVAVLCTLGTPARGGTVYIVTSNGGTGAIGDFQATSSAFNVALTATQAEWASDGMDASGNCELRIYR